VVFLNVGLGHRAAVGVGVHQQDLAAGGRLEGEVDGDGGASRRALRPPDRGQDPPIVGVGLPRGLLGADLDRYLARRLRVVVGGGFGGFGGQRRPGPVHQPVRCFAVDGDVHKAELAELALTGFVTDPATPTTASPAAASRARASWSSQRVPAATIATSA
jgi:hypothetical protein